MEGWLLLEVDALDVEMRVMRMRFDFGAENGQVI